MASVASRKRRSLIDAQSTPGDISTFVFLMLIFKTLSMQTLQTAG